MNTKPLSKCTKSELVAIVARKDAELAALRLALSSAKAPAAEPVQIVRAEPTDDSVVLWKNDAQRRFWFEKAIYRLHQDNPDARSFTKADVQAKAAALFVAAGARKAA